MVSDLTDFLSDMYMVLSLNLGTIALTDTNFESLTSSR